MEQREVECPMCVQSGFVRLRSSKSVYRIEVFVEDPRESTGILGRSPKPEAKLGTTQLLDRDRQTRKITVCGDGHYLRVIAASYVDVPAQQALVEAPETPDVECPNCRFRFGSHTNFIKRLSKGNPLKDHVLREVTFQPKPDHTEVKALTTRNMTNNERITVLKQCPHCGESFYFNYRTRAVEKHVHPVQIDGQ